jgi:hypothetical protein
VDEFSVFFNEYHEFVVSLLINDNSKFEQNEKIISDYEIKIIP